MDKWGYELEEKIIAMKVECLYILSFFKFLVPDPGFLL